VVEPEVTILIGASLLLGAVLASRISSRLGIPVLLIFLGIGMLAGTDGPGGIAFTDPHTAQLIGVVALVLILFSGGLSTPWRDARPVLGYAAALSTLGVVITALVVGGAAVWLVGLDAKAGLLLGAIVSSTDAAAVFAVLRGRDVNLRPPLAPLLELESGANDPTATILTLGLIEVIVHPDTAIPPLVLLVGVQFVVGALGGLAAARGGVWLINHVKLDFEGLFPVLTLAVTGVTFAAATLLKGSGFLAVYVAGIAMGNADFLHKKSLMRFHDALAWLAQIAMFLALGLLVLPSELPSVAGDGLLIAAVLMFVARPAAVMVSLALTKLPFRDRVLVSWIGLRGAVPIVLATFPLVRGVEKADVLFHVVFFVVITSVLLQGTSAPVVARWLGLSTSEAKRPSFPIESIRTTHDSSTAVREFTVEPGSVADGTSIVNLGLRDGTLAVLVNRGDEFVVPQGSTTLAAGDRILIVSDVPGDVADLFAGDGAA
jgi:cell volume regulation protein A